MSSTEFPLVDYTNDGVAVSVPANGSQVWADSGTEYSYSTAIVVSPVERLQLSGSPTGSITGSSSMNETYTQQFLVNASYLLEGASQTNAPTSPQLSLNGNDTNISFALTQNGSNYWINYGSSWLVSSNLGSSSAERWLGTDTSGMVISTVAELSRNILHNILLRSLRICQLLGLSQQKMVGMMPTQVYSLEALANHGWNFEMWTGSAGTFNQSSTSVVVNAPINETAIFTLHLKSVRRRTAISGTRLEQAPGPYLADTSITLFVPPRPMYHLVLSLIRPSIRLDHGVSAMIVHPLQIHSLYLLIVPLQWESPLD